MPNPSPAPLHRVSILATEGVFASTLMQAKDFFHMASLRYGKQQGLGLRVIVGRGQRCAGVTKPECRQYERQGAKLAEHEAFLVSG